MAKKNITISTEGLGKKILNFLALTTAVGTLLSGGIWVLEKIYHEEVTEYKGAVEYYKTTKDSIVPYIKEELKQINAYIENKNKTFAVGLRIEKLDGDLYYKHIDGELYRATYYEQYGAYYFTNKEGFLEECH